MSKSVFISSTSKDLLLHRAAVKKAIEELEMRPVDMVNFGSQPGSPITVSINQVRKGNYFVGIIAHRYGYVPEGSTESITQQEYNEAVRLRRPRLMYLVNLEYDWEWDGKTNPENQEDALAKARLRDFRNHIQLNELCRLFTTPEELALHVTTDIARLITQQNRRNLILLFFVAVLSLATLAAIVLIADAGVRTPLLVQFGIITETPTATPSTTSTPTITPEDTATPTATSTPTPDPECKIEVLVSELNFRNTPSVDSEVSRIFTQGTIVTGTGRTDNMDWWEVDHLGRLGWISANPELSKALTQACNDIPIIPIVSTVGSTALEQEIIVDDRSIGTGLFQFDYIGNWDFCTACDTNTWERTNTWTFEADSSFVFRFSGIQAIYWGVTDVHHGIAEVTIDGQPYGEIDFFSPNRIEGIEIWRSPRLENGQHLMLVRASGRKNPQSGGITIPVDRIDVVVPE